MSFTPLSPSIAAKEPGSIIFERCSSLVAPITRSPAMPGPIASTVLIGQWSLPEPSLVTAPL